MDAELRSFAGYYLTGKRLEPGLEPIGGLGLRPALLARYHDLDALRYDYPVILVRDAAPESSVLSLSALFDAIAPGSGTADEDRLRQHALRLERELRRGLPPGPPVVLSVLWDEAEGRLLRNGDALLRASLSTLRARLEVEGEVVACDRDLPRRAIAHWWKRMQAEQAQRMVSEIDRLIFRLCEQLRGAVAASEAGVSAERLAASFSPAFAADFDFDAMSRVLRQPRAAQAPADERPARIERLLATLRSQRFFRPPQHSGASASPVAAYDFHFERGGAAIAAWRERLPALLELAKAMLLARLEIDGEYREGACDALLDSLAPADLGPAERAQFPSYLVCLSERGMDAGAWSEVMDALAAGLPAKILVVTDEVLEPLESFEGHAPSGARVRQLGSTAIGMGGIHVLQSGSSHLYRLRDRIVRGLRYDGPALFAVYSGAGAAMGDLPPYLAAAAATESRVFPAFSYDPSAGPDWAARFALDGNPQCERDWPVHDFSCEDEALQRVSARVAFTLVDFAACDARFTPHFARVPGDRQASRSLIPAADCIESEGPGMPERIPYLLMAGPDHALHRVLVDARLIREARRCRDQWRRLQQWSAIPESHAEGAVAPGEEAEARAQRSSPVRPPDPAAARPALAPAAPAGVAPASRSDEACIETPRCTSCNECIHVNDRMFRYDENRQAYLADLSAGSYAELVLAAESCQVAIIHPGKPRNPDEPGLEELLRRAAPFR